jgi:hypothetical protein
MITNQQMRKLRRLDGQGIAKEVVALRVGMDAKTARKYRRLGKLPSEVVSMDRNWRTRPDPFAEVWPEIEVKLQVNTGLEAKTLFADLQRRFPGRFAEGQLRTLQRHIKSWRAQSGPAKEVFFAQVHHPGRLGASDFTHGTKLGVTINGSPFEHMLYHFVLTYSNWEAVTVCFSESFESLSEGFQNALWELGGAPQMHRTDRLTAAVQPGVEGPESFKQRYQALLSHYGLQGQAIQTGKGNENGDAEQSHNQFKRAVDQALMMRGSRDFTSRDSYLEFLREQCRQKNAGRADRLAEEVALLRPLPSHRLEACKRLRVRVETGSIIKVQNNVYSVASRLIGEWVEARLYAECVEVWYAQKMLERMPRLRGRGKHRIDYRHVIDWLVRKPGAFADYRYREDLFPSSHFRMAYDVLRQRQPARADKEYLRILHLAARESEAGVEAVLVEQLKEDGRMDAAAVGERLRQQGQFQQATEVTVAAVDLSLYDALLDGKEADDGEGQGREGEAGSVSEGTAPASLPEQLRGAGASGAAGGTELRAVPAGAGPAGVPGAAEQARRASAARVEAAAGEELVGIGPEAAAGQGGTAGADAARGFVPGSCGERAGLRSAGLGQDALAECVGSGAGA